MGGFDATLEPGSTAGATESTAQAVPASSIEAQLQGKTTEEKADIKAQAIYESSPYGSYTDSAYDIRIDIIDLDKIDRGIQVFAKAWRGDTQLGFGEDGSVEIERFRVFNPPVMVPDGTYRTVVEQVGPNSIEMEVANYKEDPAEAIRRAIAHTAHVVGKDSGNIVAGKVGQTTDVFYPTAAEDGDAGRNPGSTENWENIRSRAGTEVNSSSAARVMTYIYTPSGGNNWQSLHRSVFIFDTSSLPDSEPISSATLSLYGSAKADNLGISPAANVYRITTGSNTAISASDYEIVNWNGFGLADTISYASWSIISYNDFELNADGIAIINTSGRTKLGVRDVNYDAANITPSQTGGDDSHLSGYYADQTGSSQDPKLIVEHSIVDADCDAFSADVGYGALEENGDFRSYELWDGCYWEVTDKYGTVYTFGASSTSKIVNTVNASSTYRWLLEEVRDRNDNYITYTYEKDSGFIYPSTITYTGNGSSDGIYEIVFSRESRADIATSSAPGFPIASKYRINEIQVKVNGVTERTYDLGYGTGDNGRRSILTSITEAGIDEDGATTTLPAVTFEYTTKEANWTQTSPWISPAPFVDDYAGTDADWGVRFDDFNGDAYADAAWYRQNATNTNLYFNNGDGSWATTTPTGPSAFVTLEGEDLGKRAGDVDGDGRADFIPNSGNVLINTDYGTSFATSSVWLLPVAMAQTDTLPSWDLGTRIVDINGDGLPDILRSYATSTATSSNATLNGIHLNNGTGWDAASSTTWMLPYGVFFAGFTSGVGEGADFGVRFADFNSDGLTDIMESRESGGSAHMMLHINDGDGTWTSSAPTGISLSFVSDAGQDYGVRVVDANADGLADIVDTTDTTDPVYINRGGGDFQASWGDIVPDFVSSGADRGSRFVDIDADGIVDIMRSYAGTNAGSVANDAYLGNGVVPDLLKIVTTGAGATTTIAYKPSPQYAEGGEWQSPRLPLLLQTVETITTNNGFGAVGTTTYTYGGGEYYYADAFDRKFAAFATTTSTDTYGNVTNIYAHQGNATHSTLGEYSDSRAKIGKPYRTEVYDDSDNLMMKRIDRWDSASLSNSRTFVKKVRSTELQYDGDADHKDKATTFAYDDLSGNLSEQVELGEVTGSDDGSYTDTGSDTRTTSYSYATSTTNGIYALPQTLVVKDNSGTRIAQTNLYYDDLALGSVSIGNLTKEERWISGSDYASTTKDYNSYGLVTSETDPRGNTTTYVYESGNMYVATTTNALSQVTETYRDLSSGKARKVVDPNGRSFETVFDGLDRVVTEKIPDHLGTPSNTITKTTYAYTDTPLQRKILRTDNLNTATSTLTYTYLDGFLRPIQERVEAETTGYYDVKDTIYDGRGDVIKDSLPYLQSGSARSAVTTTASLLIKYGFDALRRATSTINVKGTESYTYDQWEQVITDRNGNTKDLTSDAFGNLVQVDEHNASSTYITVYTYDALNNLTSITDALDNERNFTYDGLSRLLTSQDLHAPADGSYGTRSFEYDLAGNIASTTDAKSQTTAYTYDALNRVLTEDYTGSAGTEIEYGYDSCTNGEGRLCAATTTEATTNLAYDAVGNINSESRAIDGTTYTTTFTRDRLGNLTSIIYPNSREVSYGYSDAGQLESINTRPSGGSWTTIVEDLDYAPTRQVSYKKFGNNIETSYDYDAAELYRLMNITTGVVPAGGSMEDAIIDDPAMEQLAQDFLAGLANPVQNDASSAASTTEPALEIVPEVLGVATSTDPAPSRDEIVPDNTFVPLEEATSTEATSPPEIDVDDTTATTTDLATSTTDTATTTVDIATTTVDIATTTATTTKMLEEDPIFLSLAGKTRDEKASIKSDAIVALNPVGQFTDAVYGLTIEILSVGKIEGGVQVFAKAWKDGIPIGFGSDGTIETERFRIFNPPILVPDGTKSTTTEKVGPNEITVQVDNFKVDPAAAVQQTLAHIVHVAGTENAAVVEGTVGNTTDTYYPDANPESTSVDGDVGRGPGTAESWSTIRSASTGTTGDNHDSNASRVTFYIYSPASSGDSWGSLHRSYYLFDTSALPEGNEISSATLSLYGNAKSDALSITPDINIYSSNPASNTALVPDDYDQHGTTAYSTAITYSGWSTSGYNDFALNGSGIAAISATGVSKFGARNANYDVSGTVPTHSVSADSYVHSYYADQTGTTNDPKLVIVHDVPNDPSGTIQNINFTYDSVGNITNLADYSTSTGKIIDYTYDDLYRLTNATTSAASSTSYAHSYTYNSIGNLTTKSDIGSYTYAGTNYANPHAPTTINGVTYAYDNNGNLTTAGSNTYTWNYRDRLTQVATGTATVTYGYDHDNQRVWQRTTTSATTTYPNRYYTVSGATTTANVFLPDGTLVAYIEGTPTATSTYYVHQDHLGSTHVVTNASSTVVQSLDYYPYGSTRIDSGTDVSSREYIGEFFDEESDLSYLNARYYSNPRGQFNSQDPTHVAIGNLQQIKQLTGKDQSAYLGDPQSLNSYSYARNNPITNKDPQGNFAFAIPFYYAAITAPEWGPAVGAGIIAAATYIATDISLRNNSGYRYIPFNEQGREVQVPGTPDPLNPWDGWKPGDPKDWKTWVGAGLGIIGVAAELYQKAQDLPSSSGSKPKIGPATGGTWTPLAPLPTGPNSTQQGGTGQQSQSNGAGSASYRSQIASIQAQINRIQAQINAIVRSRSGTR